jgi:thioredoxin reductase
LSIESEDGTAFTEASREQVDNFGTDHRQGEAVTEVTENGEGFLVGTDEGEYESSCVVLATGADRSIAEDLGCETTDDGVVDVDVTMETSVPNAYATGAMVRTEEWQAVISAGDGAAAALNVLTKERGEHFHDFDVPADAE